MQSNDLPELERRLVELVDALGGKAPTKGALKVWLDALRECHFDDVQSALTDWPKSHIKPPTPAEVLKACRERTSSRIEETARRNSAAPGFSVDQIPASTAVAKRALAEVREILATAKPDPKDWARILQVKDQCGDALSMIQRSAYREALGVTE